MTYAGTAATPAQLTVANVNSRGLVANSGTIGLSHARIATGGHGAVAEGTGRVDIGEDTTFTVTGANKGRARGQRIGPHRRFRPRDGHHAEHLARPDRGLYARRRPGGAGLGLPAQHLGRAGRRGGRGQFGPVAVGADRRADDQPERGVEQFGRRGHERRNRRLRRPDRPGERRGRWPEGARRRQPDQPDRDQPRHRRHGQPELLRDDALLQLPRPVDGLHDHRQHPRLRPGG